MEDILIRPSLLRSFGSGTGCTFCVVTDAEHAGRVRFDGDGGYADRRVFTFDGARPFDVLLEHDIPQHAHVLVILPRHYFKSPEPALLGRQRKLATMACFSTPTSDAAIRHFIACAEATDPDAQTRMADEFFERGERAAQLHFVDDEYGTEARFAHLSDSLSWHEQVGSMAWGQQQLFPSGEVSVLPVDVFGQDIEARFDFNGTLALQGIPVLHAGTPSFLPMDQARIHAALATLREHAVIATVCDGLVTDLVPTHSHCVPAAHMLEAMFAVDSRYRSLLEIGFGMNTTLTPFPGNAAMNEVYGGTHGVVHFGLGLIPYTQYHLDLLSPGTRVLDSHGEHVFGGALTTA